MRPLVEEVRSCRKCGLWKSRRNAVPGEGSLDSSIAFVGEAPGYWEDVKGRPFVGAAGKLLDGLLAGIGLSRGVVYITNILKCRPPGNRDPRPDEIRLCTPYLDQQMEIIKPRFIVALGRHSTAHMLSKAGLNVMGITKVRGKISKVNLWGSEVSVLPTYHPAAALYNVKLKEDLERDYQLLKGEIEKLSSRSS